MRVKKLLAEIPAKLLQDAKVKGLEKWMSEDAAVSGGISFDELRNALGGILEAEGISPDDLEGIRLASENYGEGQADAPLNHHHQLIFDVKGLPAGFFLDLCLPPDRAEETRVGLQDVYERRWLKRYPRPVARAFCRVHAISIILAHWGKFIAVVFGFLGLKKFTGWFSEP
jgi:hypothetical protein